MKRTIVQEGRKPANGETPSGVDTPTTPEAGNEPSGNPKIVEENRKRSASDLEKGLNGSEDEADVKDEEEEIEEEYTKKG